jgi:outer membrane immunogenic protein
MNKTFALVAITTALVATPVMAGNSFTGVRAEVTAGFDDVTGERDLNNVTYGIGVGVDAEVYPRVIVGAEATLDNVFDRRNIGAGARLGYTFGDRVLVYTKAGWANFQPVPGGVKLDGFRVGGGVEARVVGNIYAKAEYRYTDFASGVGQHAGLAGIGFRF